MQYPVIALDVGGATLKATCIPAAARPASHKPGKHSLPLSVNNVTRSITTLANQVATVASGTTQLLGKELLDKECQRAKLHYLRPMERGYCVNWNVETELWSHLFSNSKMLGVNPHDHALVTTGPLFAPAVLNETMDQVVFEEFGFQSYARVHAAEMCVLSYSAFTRQQEEIANGDHFPSVKRKKGSGPTVTSGVAVAETQPPAPVVEDWKAFHKSSCQLVIDSGFSFTHVVPVIDGAVFLPGVKRMNVGGKLLTNYLKEIVSYRQWNVQDETMVINELKESLCYCSLDFTTDMTRYHKERAARKHWVLPDFVRSFHGKLRQPDQQANDQQADDEQALEMGVEMVSVPEVLFHPSDIGIDQAGLAEVVMQGVNACPVDVHGTLLENILVVGGNSKFRGFRDRLEMDLRPLVPQEYEIRILQPKDPLTSAVNGCALFAQSDELASRSVSKREYDEHGSNICIKRFR